ncbi:DUF2866 domain-containing protein [Paraburkholderia acidiphila]|uniref:DUF2866 domain-containing protein n=1 Tax=Paraburkholderia acidiphila TaxID=2571747 RepID=A0A7Z2G6G4_9BURK|nr:DUF2866 domain-containing protein [Paraburkholderia acidiphila]
MISNNPGSGCNHFRLRFPYPWRDVQPVSSGKDSDLKQTDTSFDGRSIVVRGCRVSEPLMQPWGSTCRIVEWIDGDGRISRRVVAEDVTAAEVRSTIAHHVEGRKYVMYDDERSPRQTLPRR